MVEGEDEGVETVSRGMHREVRKETAGDPHAELAEATK